MHKIFEELFLKGNIVTPDKKILDALSIKPNLPIPDATEYGRKTNFQVMSWKNVLSLIYWLFKR